MESKEAQPTKPTLKDVAQLAGVSPMTVSNTLRNKRVKDETRSKVLSAAQQLNYVSKAPGKASHQRGRKGILTVLIGDIDHPFYSKFARLITDEIERNGFEALIRQTNFSAAREEDALVMPKGLPCNGLIIASPTLTSQEIHRIASDTPTVLLGGNLEDNVYDTVHLPDEDGSYAAIRYLHDAGCERIAIIGSLYQEPTRLLTPDDTGVLRYRGCYRAYRELGIPLDEHTVFPCEWGAEPARNAARNMIDTGGFDGAFCMTDIMAMGTLQVLQECGIAVPDNFKVIGFDGITIGQYLSPALTTIEPDLEEAAHMLVSALIARIDGSRSAPRKTIVGYRLAVRRSA